MTGKKTFRRTAVHTNVDGGRKPSFTDLRYVIIDVKSLVDGYSQLLVKSGWGIECREREVYAISPEDKRETMMEAIRGDESPLSYIQAASCFHLLMRCAATEERPWEEEAVIDDEYVKTLDHYGFWPFGELARSLNPLFFYDSLMHPVVVFFTYHREAKDVIVKHIHRFDYGGYGLKYGCRTWAIRNKEQIAMKRIK